MVMIRRACRFTDVLDLFLCRECHNYSPFIAIVSAFQPFAFR
jgi:hypothetical protein